MVLRAHKVPLNSSWEPQSRPDFGEPHQQRPHNSLVLRIFKYNGLNLATGSRKYSEKSYELKFRITRYACIQSRWCRAQHDDSVAPHSRRPRSHATVKHGRSSRETLRTVPLSPRAAHGDVYATFCCTAAAHLAGSSPAQLHLLSLRCCAANHALGCLAPARLSAAAIWLAQDLCMCEWRDCDATILGMVAPGLLSGRASASVGCIAWVCP